MDQAYIATSGPIADYERSLYRLRVPQTEVRDTVWARHLARLFERLSQEVTGHIGALYINGHANETGDLWVRLYDLLPKTDDDPITWTLLTNDVLAVPAMHTRLNVPRDSGGKLRVSDVHIRGCRIGQSRPMILAIKDMLTGVSVSVHASECAPSNVEVGQGSSVVWTNDDSTNHTVMALNGAFDSGPIQPGEKYRYLFDTEGTIEYVCKPHGNVGRIRVVPFRLSAPKHFSMVFTEDDQVGWFELLKYDFRVVQKNAFARKDDLIKAFQDRAEPGATRRLNYYDGRAIDSSEWSKWIPRRINKTRSYYNYYVDYGRPIGPYMRKKLIPAFRYDPENPGKKVLNTPLREFRHDTPKYSVEFYGVDKPSMHEDEGVIAMQYLREAITAAPSFTNDLEICPFPTWLEYGYRSREEFLAGWIWTPTWVERTMTVTGTRHEYAVILPITRSDGTLIYNFYPSDGAAAQYAGLQAYSELDELVTEDGLFLTV